MISGSLNFVSINFEREMISEEEEKDDDDKEK
jgi:hypothetical protein